MMSQIFKGCHFLPLPSNYIPDFLKQPFPANDFVKESFLQPSPRFLSPVLYCFPYLEHHFCLLLDEAGLTPSCLSCLSSCHPLSYVFCSQREVSCSVTIITTSRATVALSVIST